MTTENKEIMTPEQAIGRHASVREISMWTIEKLSSDYPNSTSISIMFETRVDNEKPIFSRSKKADFPHIKIPQVKADLDKQFRTVMPAIQQFHNKETFLSLTQSAVDSIIDAEVQLIGMNETTQLTY